MLLLTVCPLPSSELQGPSTGLLSFRGFANVYQPFLNGKWIEAHYILKWPLMSSVSSDHYKTLSVVEFKVTSLEDFPGASSCFSSLSRVFITPGQTLPVIVRYGGLRAWLFCLKEIEVFLWVPPCCALWNMLWGASPELARWLTVSFGEHLIYPHV